MLVWLSALVNCANVMSCRQVFCVCVSVLLTACLCVSLCVCVCVCVGVCVCVCLQETKALQTPHYKVLFSGPGANSVMVAYLPQTQLERVTEVEVGTVDSTHTRTHARTHTHAHTHSLICLAVNTLVFNHQVYKV